jgi:colanic acid/amylovoran biosynthesis glycosyltransferase
MEPIHSGQTMADAPAQRPDCRVAYLVSAFPAVSHTFIARELDALRARGVDVVTMSIRKTPADQLLSAADQRAADETFAVFPLDKWRFAAAHLRAIITRPRRYLTTLRVALSMSPGGARANLWQLFYFAESILIWSQCRRRKVRHIHAHFANVASAVALLAAEFGRPDGFRWSFTMHGYTEFDEVRRYALAEKVRRAAFVSCISDFCRSQLLKLVEPDHWDKLVVVRCGLDAREVRALPAREEASAAQAVDRPLRLLFVGRLVPEKGVLVLLWAVAELKRCGVEVDAVLVGDGPYRAELEKEAQRLGIAGQIRFTGALTGAALAPLYRETDVFCLPSFAEGLPVVLMEAMANELPVVSSRLAGIAELVDHEGNGLLLPPARADVIVDALGRLAVNPGLRARWGRAGRERVLREFDVAESAARLESLFASRGAGAAARRRTPRLAGPQGPQHQETVDASA